MSLSSTQQAGCGAQRQLGQGRVNSSAASFASHPASAEETALKTG